MRCIGYASPAWRRAAKLMGEAKKAHGVLGGGQLGCNYQFMPLFVAGLETDIQGEHARSWGVCKFSRVKIAFLGKGEPMQKLVWRVKLVADVGDEAAETEVEVARIERDGFTVPETLGLSLAESKRLTAAIQTEMVRAQATTMGERFRCCAHCGSTLSGKGYRSVTFRSLFGDVPLRVRRFASCQCREIAEQPRSFSALTLEGGIARELAYVTAKFATLAPFAKIADLLAELLPVGGAINGGTVRNRTRRVGERIARLRPEGAADPDVDAVTPAVVIGLDGGYLRSRHRRPERNFEVIAGKVLNLDGSQHRFAFARNGNSVIEFTKAVVSAGIRLGTPATVLCDGDPGLWKLQRQVMPDATSSSTGFISPCVSNTPCRRCAALAPVRPATISTVIQSASSRAPSGNFGTAARTHVSGAWRA